MRVKNILLLCFCLLVFVQCNDNDDYYDQPNWLEEPIYQVLEKEGRFSSYLKCVDRTPYAPVLKAGGLYTVFAPNDEAFAIYLQENNYTSVEVIPQEIVDAIVSYSMVFSRWEAAHLGDVFTGGEYELGTGVKKKTAFYHSIYKDPDFDGKWVFDQNVIGGYAEGFNNYKYMPIFTTSYFGTKLSASDYNVFFPNVEYTGRNVYNGKVLATDLIARNGVAHEVSTVLYPLKNMNEILLDSDYEAFKYFLDFKTISGEYAYKSYVEYPTLTDFFKKTLPDLNIDKVYLKTYDPTLLYFSPVFELYEGGLVLNEKDGYTLFVPTNEALNEFIENKLLKYYKNLHELPLEVITALVNTHMVDGMIWPSVFAQSKNSTEEFLNGVGTNGDDFYNSGIVDKKIASNGFVYIIDHVLKSKYFETVFAEVILNPDNSMLYTAFTNFYKTSLFEDLTKGTLNGYPTSRYSVLLLSNDLLKEDGFGTTFDGTNTSFVNDKILSGKPDDRLKRLIRMHMFQGYVSGNFSSEVDSFEGNASLGYNGWGFRVTHYGDMVRFKDNKIQAVGNIEDNTFAQVELYEEYENGKVFVVDKMLQYSPRWTQASVDQGWAQKSLWKYLEQTKSENTNVSTFVDYVQACLKASETDELAGINEENYYTILMITNNMMRQAINTGVIPALSEITGESKDVAKLEIATKFIRAHFLQGRAYADDGLEYLYPYNVMEPNKDLPGTMLRITNEGLGLINQRTYVQVTKNANSELIFAPQNVVVGNKTLITGATYGPMKITRGQVNAANPDKFRSNRMAGRSVLHELNGYIMFKEE